MRSGALLGTGGLLAYFGQTYQSGADPWQLFALWSALCLPLCLALRHDALWTPWVIVSTCAITLWIGAHTGSWWHVSKAERMSQMSGWTASFLLTMSMGRRMRHWTGAGDWPLRLAALASVVLIGTGGVGGAWNDGLLAWFSLILLTAAACWFALGEEFDVFGLSAVALAVNVVLDAAMVDGLFATGRLSTGRMLVLGLCMAVLLGGTVVMLVKMAELHKRDVQS